jgi:hypothetical protein
MIGSGRTGCGSPSNQRMGGVATAVFDDTCGNLIQAVQLA